VSNHTSHRIALEQSQNCRQKKVAKSESQIGCTRTHWSPKTMAINSGEEKGNAHPYEK